MKISPYIFFYGRCEEALTFYKSILGGDYELTKNDEGPMADQIPADFKGKVMHSTFTSGDLTFMASDGMGGKSIDPEAGNITLCIEADNRADGERIFKSLSSGGKVKMPYEQAFWGGRFGALDDRFGIEWYVTSD
jgi:PhnB protein